MTPFSTHCLKICVAAASGVLCIAAPAIAEEKDDFLPTLFLSESAIPHDSKEWEIAAKTDYFHGRAGGGAGYSLAVGYGVTDRLTLEIELPYLIQSPSPANDESGFGGIAVNGLYNFYRTSDTMLSAYTELHIPVSRGNGELGTQNVESAFELLAARKFGNFELDASIGAVVSPSEPAEVTYSVAGSYPTGSVWSVLELSGAEGEDHTLYLTPGVVWAKDSNEIAFGVPVGLTHDSETWGLLLEFTHAF